MKAQSFFPGFTLILGLGLGVIITKTFDSSSSPSKTEQPLAPTRSSAPSSIAPGSPPFDRSLASLLQQTPLQDNTFPPLELLLTIESLGAEDIAKLHTELDDLHSGDPRSVAVREALLKRWALLDPEAALSAAMNSPEPNRAQSLVTVFSIITENDHSRAKLLALEMEKGATRERIIRRVAATLATTDPVGALRFLDRAELPSSELLASAYDSIFQAWSKQEPGAALAAAEALTQPHLRQQALVGIIKTITKDDPQRAWSLADRLQGESRHWMLSEIVQQISSSDPAKARDFLEQMPPGKAKDFAVDSFASNWVKHDPKAAFAWIRTLPGSKKMEIADEVIGQQSQNNASEVLAFLAELPAGNQTAGLYKKFVGGWAMADPEAAAKWADELPPGQIRQDAMRQAIYRLSESDPVATAHLLEDEPLTRQSTYQFATLAHHWVQQDPEATFSWIRNLDFEGESYRGIVGSAISQLAQSDVSAAAEFALNIEDRENRDSAISSLLNTWSRNDLAEAKNWMEQNLAPEQRLTAYRHFISNHAFDDPSTAKELLDEANAQFSSPEAQAYFRSLSAQIARNWAETEPAAAADWVQTLPNDNKNDRILDDVVGKWANYDPNAAAKFVLDLEKGSNRDSAVTGLVESLKQSDPEAAFLWANSVSNDNTRDQLIRDTIQNHWADSDPAAARKAISEANISTETRSEILNILQYR